MTTAILYHANCIDGFTAAWAIDRYAVEGAKDVRPVTHGEPMPDDLESFDQVFIVDFSYPYAELAELAESTELVLLDHHRTALDEITGARAMEMHHPIRFNTPFFAWLDEGRSGAGIAWDFATDGDPRPALVDYVEDRDLWNNRLEGTREVSAYLRTLPHDLGTWDELAQTPIETLIALGTGCTRQLDAVIRAAVEESYMCEMGGREFPITNVAYLAGSETAEALCAHWESPMAGYYFRQADGRWKYGFRSRDGSTTVHDFAAQFGGGGHPAAAGAVCDVLEHLQIPHVA